MQVLKSFKPDSSFFKNSTNYTTENLILYALVLYTITNNETVLYFILGIGINGLMYFILKNEKYYDGKKFPSLSMQTFTFLYAFIITKKILDETLTDINPLFILIGVGMCYLIISDTNNTFPALLMGGFVGASLGIIYSWLISSFVEEKKEDDIKVFGAPYSDYNTCEAIEEENLPRVIEKESNRRSTCA